MPIVTAKGTFAANTSTGNQSVSHATLASTPVAIILWVTPLTAAGYGVNAFLSYGVATSSSQRWCIGLASSDLVNPSSNWRFMSSTLCIRIPDGPTSVNINAEADFVSFNADTGSGAGFTINWTDAPSSAWIVHYFLIGGTSVTNAKAGTFTVATTGATQAFTDPGFQPDLLLFGTARLAAVGTATPVRFSIGAASGASNEGALFVGETHAVTPTDVSRYQRIVQSLNLPSAASPMTVDLEADLASMDASGFTLNVTNLPSAGQLAGYLALKGGNYIVLNDTQKTSTGTQAKTGAGFKPTGALFFGVGAANSTTIDLAAEKLTIGAADAWLNEGCVWASGADNVATTDENMCTVTTKVFRHATGPSTTDAEANLQSFDADGYTLNWTTATATANQFIVVLFGPPTSFLWQPTPAVRYR